MATNLIYQQTVRGIKFGEYRCDKEDDLAMIAAQQFYIDYGANLQPQALSEALGKYLPDFALNESVAAYERWMALVTNAFRRVNRL